MPWSPGGLTEGEIVTHDLELVAVGVLNGIHGYVAVGGLLIIRKLDVIELGATDDAFLFLDVQRVPGGEVVDVLLLNDVTAARPSTFVDKRRCDSRLPPRTLGTVDEAQRVSIVQVAEGVDLIVGVDHGAQSAHDLAHQLKAHVER